MRFTGRAFRGHHPKWSFDPLSGTGAALTGGRFNRPGRATLYLSLEIVTAVAECTQGLGQRLLPLTICEYDVDCEPVADLRDAAGCAGHGIDPADLSCGWLTFQRAGRAAPSQRAAEKLARDGFAGMLVPSFFPGATPANTNLVLWRWGDVPPTQIGVHDPSRRLPRDQSSWDAPSG